MSFLMEGTVNKVVPEGTWGNVVQTIHCIYWWSKAMAISTLQGHLAHNALACRKTWEKTSSSQWLMLHWFPEEINAAATGNLMGLGCSRPLPQSLELKCLHPHFTITFFKSKLEQWSLYVCDGVCLTCGNTVSWTSMRNFPAYTKLGQTQQIISVA